MRLHYRFMLFGVGLFLLAACTPPVADEFFVVDTTNDSVDANPGDGVCADAAGDCSLRAAVMEGNTDANTTEIQLSPGQTYTLSLSGADEDGSATGDLDLLERTYIRTPIGAEPATISADELDRVVDAISGSYHFLEGLVLTDGSVTGDGGALLIRTGLVGIEDSRVTANTASAAGGAIKNIGGSLWIEDSTVDGNNAGANGAAISSNGFAHLFQTTVVDNTDGGTDAQVETTGSAELQLISSTITGEDVGLALNGGSSTLSASIVDAPTACVVGGAITTSGGNVASDATCNLGPADIENADVQLFGLADNGGPTPTRLPAYGSPVVDAVALASAGCTAPVSPDARGATRPVNGACDAGAVEQQLDEAPGIDCTMPPDLGLFRDLQNCDLSSGAWPFVNLTGSDLTGSNVSDTVFTNANFFSTTLVDTDFSSAVLTNVNLTNADLSDADLSDTDLTDATLTGATLTGVTWASTTCPDGTNSDDNGDTCEFNL